MSTQPPSPRAGRINAQEKVLFSGGAAPAEAGPDNGAAPPAAATAATAPQRRRRPGLTDEERAMLVDDFGPEEYPGQHEDMVDEAEAEMGGAPDPETAPNWAKAARLRHVELGDEEACVAAMRMDGFVGTTEEACRAFERQMEEADREAAGRGRRGGW